MKKKSLMLGLGSLAVIAVAALWYVAGSEDVSDEAFISPSDSRMVAQGEAIYAQHCASCHGAKLEGQPDWRQRLPSGRLPAPPHDESGHTWHHPDIVLIDIIKHGLVPGRTAPDGYQSDMPAYGSLLSDEEIHAVLAYIKSRWPPEALAAQKEVSLQSAHGAH